MPVHDAPNSLVWQGIYHRGIDNARNVASIVKEILA